MDEQLRSDLYMAMACLIVMVLIALVNTWYMSDLYTTCHNNAYPWHCRCWNGGPVPPDN